MAYWMADLALNSDEATPARGEAAAAVTPILAAATELVGATAKSDGAPTDAVPSGGEEELPQLLRVLPHSLVETGGGAAQGTAAYALPAVGSFPPPHGENGGRFWSSAMQNEAMIREPKLALFVAPEHLPSAYADVLRTTAEELNEGNA